MHFVTVLSGAYFCTEPNDRGQNDTDTRHRDIRQPERGSRQDDPLRHLRQLPCDERRACRGHRLRFPAFHPEVPQGRHQEIRRGSRTLRRAGLRGQRQAGHDRAHGEAAQRPQHRRGTHGLARQPEGGGADTHVRQLGHHRRAVPLRPGDRPLHRELPPIHRPPAQGRGRTDESPALHRPQPP